MTDPMLEARPAPTPAAVATNVVALHSRTSSIERMLERARLGWTRLSARQAFDAQADGALIVDVRTEAQRAEAGEIPGAIVIDLTVLEWRLDPTSTDRIPEASWEQSYILICRQGYSSSLAVARLQALGLRWSSDVIGGVEAWLDADLPLTRDAADVRR